MARFHGWRHAPSSVDPLSAYAPLVDGLVPQDKLGIGTQDGTKFLRDDGTWQEIDPGEAGEHPNLAEHDTLGLATQAELDAHLNDGADAHDASAISVVPVGGIAANTVQAAIEELDSEKSGSGHAHSHASTTGQGVDDHHARDHSVVGATHTGFPGGTSTFLRADGSFAAPTAAAADLDKPEIGTLSVATAKYHLTAVRHQCTGSQRISVAGSGRLRIQN